MLCNSKTGFPVFDGVECKSDDRHFAICGGGGSAKSGVPNKVSLCTLGPRADGHAGVSLVEVASVSTNEKLATSCCMIGADFVVYLIDEKDVIVSQRRDKELVEKTRYTATDKLEKVRCFGGKWLLLAAETGPIEVLVFDPANVSLVPKTKLSFHRNAVVDLSFTSPGLLASASSDDTIRVWDLETGTPQSILPADVASKLTHRRVRFSSKDQFVLKLFSLQVPKNRKGASFIVVWGRMKQQKDANWTLLQVEQVSKMLVMAFTVCTDRPLIAIGSADLSVTILHEETLRPLRTVNKIHTLTITGLFFRGDHVVSSSADGTCAMVAINDLNSFSIFQVLKSIVKIIVFIVVFLVLFSVFFVSRNVKGQEARDHFVESILRKDFPIDISRVDPANIAQFFQDFLYT